MIRLRKVSFLNDARKNRTPLYYWSLGAGFITTLSFITIGYFYYSYRIRQRTKKAIAQGQVERIVSTDGLNSEELQKAIEILKQQKIHEKIQVDNFERYRRLRELRRQEEGLN